MGRLDRSLAAVVRRAVVWNIGTSILRASQGKYAEALPWLERAVAAKETGDVHGRVDFQSLGLSLDLASTCHASLGNVDDARIWSERATRVKQRGEP